MIVTQMKRPLNESLYTLNLEHLKKLTTPIGVWQHCKGGEPNIEHGYSIDDVARALIVAVELWKRDIDRPYCEALGRICLGFIEKAALDNGKFHNFADKDGNWVDSIGSDDSFGRTLWGLAIAYQANLDFAPATQIRPLLDRSLANFPTLGPLRSRAFVLQALSYLPDEFSADARCLLAKLEGAYFDHETPTWQWYEDQMTYCNGRVPIALFLGSRFSNNPTETKDIAFRMLDFLLETCWQEGFKGYAPIGNNGWFNKGDVRPPVFDQQPVDTGVLVEACCVAASCARTGRYANAAKEAMEWYKGRNIHEQRLYVRETGGVYDALTPNGVNLNQGAESILSYILASIALDNLAR